MKLKLTHHAVSYKMVLHPAELERNSSFCYPFSRVFTIRFSRATDAVTLLRALLSSVPLQFSEVE